MNEVKDSFPITQEIIDRFIKFEGYARHFYLDGKSVVTIGIGCVIPNVDSAARLNMRFKENNSQALVEVISSDFMKVKAAPSGKSVTFYDTITRCYLPDKDVMNLFLFRARDKVISLRSQFQDFDKLPHEAKEVLLDFAFNVGISGLILKFPRFVDNIRNRKWKRAALDAHRKGIQEERNAWAIANLNSIQKD